MREYENNITQPPKDPPIFGNWDVIAKAWYIVCASSALKKNQIISFKICQQRIVLFRGDDNKVRALDAYCPHLGTDLAIGKVVGNHIQCYFHHWQYDGTGACVKIPCQNSGHEKVRTKSYDIDERYGAIWVYPDAKAPDPVPVPDELVGKDLIFYFGKPCFRSCHYHVGMINGIDAQHLRTVHNLTIEMSLTVVERDASVIDFVMSGEIPKLSLAGKVTRFFLGQRYEYAMRYCSGSIGILTLVRNCNFQGFVLPRIYLLYAYRPDVPGRTFVQPIYFTERRRGVLEYLKSLFLMGCTAIAYRYLQDEDAKIYENIRFSTNYLLSIDQPIARIMGFINKLPPSEWSPKYTEPTEPVRM